MNSFDSPGAFTFVPLSNELYLASHQWNPDEMFLHPRPLELFSKGSEVGAKGFVVAHQSFSETTGALLLSDLKLRKYECHGTDTKLSQAFKECRPGTRLAYHGKRDELWLAGGSLSVFRDVSSDEPVEQPVSEDESYDDLRLIGDTLYVKARRRNSRMNEVVVVDVFDIAEAGEPKLLGTLEELYGPRLVAPSPQGGLLAAAGWANDPYLRVFKVEGAKSELVNAVKVEIESPFDRLEFIGDGLLLATTDRKLLVFTLSSSGEATLVTEISQCCSSFLGK